MKALKLLNNYYVLALILVIAAIMRLYHIDYQSVWLDEVHTLNEADPSLTMEQVFDLLRAGDQHPPMYFLLVKLCFTLFGYTTFVMRVLSAFIGIAGVAAIFLLGKEIYNRQVGLYASALLAVNYFHLFHSQDARPYSLLLLTTVVSFYFLIRFIKVPSAKSAVLYALFAALMIYSHFFALFALVSQAVILLYYIYRPYGVTSRKFFLYCVLAGILIIALYLPCYSFLLAATKITSFWIPYPTLTTYKEIWKEFFGHSNAVIYIVLFLIALYYVLFFARKRDAAPGTTRKTYQLSILVLSLWFLITVLIPVIRSYTSVPMIISRYFINILPAVLIAAAIGLYQIKNAPARHILLVLICVLSVNNITFQKKYYTVVSKTQFREVTQYIQSHSTNRVPVVTSLYWHFSHFFKRTGYRIIPNDLNTYVGYLKKNEVKKEVFWYTDAHGRVYNPTTETEAYLRENYYIQTKINYLDTYAIQYVPKEDKPDK